jgi:ubiquinone/menaquinone biosynthesis C-methylase UbiE
MEYKDHFSGHAASYASARPDYPRELFTYLASLCNEHELAWDCACGNGQASVTLAEYFRKVVATDASEQQISQAKEHASIEYKVVLAEEQFLPEQSIDLVIVAQAAHWFNLPLFYKNLNQVLKHKGVVALWCYAVNRIDPEIDKVVEYLYEDLLGPFWPEERRLVEASYQDINLPFKAVQPPEFELVKQWSCEQLIQYLNSWSALQKYKASKGEDPMDHVRPMLENAWGQTISRAIKWPLGLKVAIK